MLLLNSFFTIFSFIWLVGHSTVRVFDWEFWFALVYFLLCAANSGYLYINRLKLKK
jgi:hypothetical protein